MTVKDLIDIVDPGTEWTLIDNHGVLILKSLDNLSKFESMTIISVSALETRNLLVIVQ